MRLRTLVMVVFSAAAMQSCRIEMPPLIQLIGEVYGGLPSAYDFTRSEAIRVQGFRDTLLLGDEPGSTHAIRMQNILEKAGVPRKNIVLFEDFRYIGVPGNEGLYFLTSGDHEALRKATRIVHVPLLTPLREPQDAPRIAANNIVFVLSAGNVREFFNGDRDMYNVKHTRWNHDDLERDRQSKVSYQSILDVYNTGKVLAATSAKVAETEISPENLVVRCGDIKEVCFTVIPEQFTSDASARLAAMSFYLSQFYPTAEEIVETLQVCAVDIGEPGIDREYGRGLANLLCPRVLEQEISVVSEHIEERKESFSHKGGDLIGIWKANNTPLRVYIPPALRETIQPRIDGNAVGEIRFDGKDIVTANFTATADITAVFLMELSALATDTVQVQGFYETKTDTLTLTPRLIPKDLQNHSLSYTYTATQDSLHLTRSLTLNEAFALLPGSIADLANTTVKDLFTDDPIRITASFVKKPTLVGDFDENDIVDFSDFLLFVDAFGSTEGDPEYNPWMDLDRDGMINFSDFLVFISLFEQQTG